MLTGERNQSEREKKLLLEERVQILAKSDEFKNMLNATSKAKDMAVAEVRKLILKSDEQQKTIQGLDDRLAKLEALNHDYMAINTEQKDLSVCSFAEDKINVVP